MIIDDEYCQYEMWRIVNKAENDAIAAFEDMKDKGPDVLRDWVLEYRKSRDEEAGGASEENVRACAFAGKMTELIARPMDLVLIANLASGAEEHFKDTGAFAPMGEEFSGLDFFERCERYTGKVEEKDRERFIETFGFAALKKRLAEDGYASAVYEVNLACAGQPADIHEVETAYVYIGGDEALKTVRVIR